MCVQVNPHNVLQQTLRKALPGTIGCVTRSQPSDGSAPGTAIAQSHLQRGSETSFVGYYAVCKERESWSIPRLRAARIQRASDPLTNSTMLLLMDLPNESLMGICYDIHFLRHVANLGLTCKRLYAVLNELGYHPLCRVWFQLSAPCVSADALCQWPWKNSGNFTG